MPLLPDLGPLKFGDSRSKNGKRGGTVECHIIIIRTPFRANQVPKATSSQAVDPITTSLGTHHNGNLTVACRPPRTVLSYLNQHSRLPPTLLRQPSKAPNRANSRPYSSCRCDQTDCAHLVSPRAPLPGSFRRLRVISRRLTKTLQVHTRHGSAEAWKRVYYKREWRAGRL
jgi:hypothetical protein